MWTTPRNAREKAIENAAKREVANGMKQFRAFLDKVLQTAGNGVLGTIGTVSGTTLTMNTPPGAALVYVGQTIQVYDTTITTNRGSCNVVSRRPDQHDADDHGRLAAGRNHRHRRDRSRRTLGSAAHFALRHQVSPEQRHHGHLDEPEPRHLSAAVADAAGECGNSALVPGYVRLAINKVRKALGIGQLGKLIAYTSVEQEHAWENLGITISQVIKQNAAGSANDLDLLFSGRKTMSGVPIKSSINADQTRVDFLDLSHWGRAVIKDIDFFEVGEQTVFPIYGTSGGISAAFIFYFDTGFQVFSDSPRSGAYVDGLARPTGY